MSSSQLLIRIDKETKDRLMSIAKMNGKNSSEVVRELIQQYVADRDINEGMLRVWNQIGDEMKDKCITEAEIKKAIQDVRRENQ